MKIWDPSWDFQIWNAMLALFFFKTSIKLSLYYNMPSSLASIGLA
jgi:hypothetical protein